MVLKTNNNKMEENGYLNAAEKIINISEKNLSEILHHIFDLSKHLSILCMSSILISIALFEKVFKSKYGKYCLIVLVISFLISLAISLLIMRRIQIFLSANAAYFSSLISRDKQKEIKFSEIMKSSFNKIQSFLRANMVFFFLGILSLVVFVVINLFI